MTPPEPALDLIVLVADLSMQRALEKVLKRPDSLGIHEISHRVFLHQHCDPGVFRGCHEFLQGQSKNYRHALAICDHHGCGKEALPREQLETLMEGRLSNHWGNRAAAIVIDPELENWLWVDSPHVAKEIGWPRGMPDLRGWLRNEGYLTEDQAKPRDPKGALEKALRLTRKRRSSALYQTLASKVSFQECVDPAFMKLKETLRRWFPAAGA